MTLRAEGLTVSYDDAPVPALDRVDLDVPAGVVTAVAGPSGAGRTTLARALAGVELPATTTGRVVRSPRVGLVGTSPHLQRSGVAPDVAAEIAFGLQYAGVGRAEQHRRVDALADALGLTSLLARSPDQLSSGEQQRVALAAVLVGRPEAVLLDDAEALLDPAGRAALVGLLARIAAAGTAVLTLGGRPEDTVTHAEWLTLLVAGRVAASGPPGVVLGSELGGRVGVRRPAITRLAADLGLSPPWPTTDAELASALAGTSTPFAGPRDRHLDRQVALPPTGSRPTIGLEAVEVGTALRGVTLEIPAGTALGVAGPNGAGKSTLARLLNGLVRPTSGWVRHDGQDVGTTPVPDLSRTVGHVFADPDQQLFARTVRAEVAFGPRAFGCADVAGRVDLSLAAVGLSAAADRHPYELSFAERKLLGLAATLAAGPPVVVLDEPTATLDQAMTARVEAVLETLSAAGRTVVLVSHDVDLLHAHVDEVLVLRDGQVHRHGPAAEVLADRDNLIGRPAALRVL